MTFLYIARGTYSNLPSQISIIGFLIYKLHEDQKAEFNLRHLTALKSLTLNVAHIYLPNFPKWK